jgi:pyruvate formate lyase activating enzyme
MLKGTVFDIQRFSVHDGPGIRTTVFMKGCPLRCRWCHNPEGLKRESELQYFEEKCIGCKRCGDRSSIFDSEKCPAGALTLCGKELDVGALLEELMRDKDFYAEGGGVTFSGGECLLQADFVRSVLSVLKSEGIHTAIDTCGAVSWSEIEKTLDVCDLYLYDVKCITPSLHKEYTGVDNALILDNLRRLSRENKEIWIRTPVIPGFNDSDEEMGRISDLVLELSSVSHLTLMPYHVLGVSKYKTIGMDYPYDSSLRVGADDMKRFKAVFASKGIVID